MEKPKAPPQSLERQCVGRLEIVRPKPVGFLCGSIPVPTDKAFHDFYSALIPSVQTVQAPRYRMIPTETDLNMLPIPSIIPDKVLPVVTEQTRAGGDLSWENGNVTSSLTQKGEALAVSGVVEYGDEIDIIAPADILKQIFKMPYSKARLSIAVQRVGQTLVLNTGPDVEEGEKLIRRHNNQSKCADESLFLNFAMHSVRMEACDCPSSHQTTSKEKSGSCVLPGQFESREEPPESSRHYMQGHTSSGRSHDIAKDENFKHFEEYTNVKQDEVFWRKKMSKRNRCQSAVKNVSQVKEKPRSSVKESEKNRRDNNDSFLRVLFWQFHNFRMLLGSDLLIFSNEKYVAVSLHLWDVSRQVTPLTWLEAWLDNVMASVPELAICYHQNGVVQGYELLKTEDIFLLKGISEDGTPAFHPHVVQQNGLMVLRFLQENCKQDPGAYWLYKSAGEDLIQLFDLSIMPKNHSPDDCDDKHSALPSLIQRGRSDFLLSLGTLLYRIAHRLSFSMSPDKRARCVRFFRQCLDLLDEPDHLVVRAFAHEQFARLLLVDDVELDLTSETIPTDYVVTVADAEEDSFEVYPTVSKVEDRINPEKMHNFDLENFVTKEVDGNLSSHSTLTVSGDPPLVYPADVQSSNGQRFSVCDSSDSASPVLQTIVDPISSKMAAVHHVSQAIKSIRWKRQLQTSEVKVDHTSKVQGQLYSSIDFSVCPCGDPDCIDVCDICQWLPASKLDDKVWKLVLLLGESYLSLGQAYKDDGQLFQALKVVELACLIYGSMPQHLEETRFISSMVCSSQVEIIGRSEKNESLRDDDLLIFQQPPSSYLFWAKAWTLAGDVYVEFHLIKDKEISLKSGKKSFTKEVKMSSEVLKEVERLKKKLGEFGQNCSSCLLVNCSCQSDRANSGSSAGTSSADKHPSAYGRKTSKKSVAKGTLCSNAGSYEDVRAHQRLEKSGYPKSNKNEMLRNGSNVKAHAVFDKKFADTDADADAERADITMKMENGGPKVDYLFETTFRETTQVRHGGIFKYVKNPVIGDGDYNLCIALECYEEARRALGVNCSSSGESESIIRKKGWVCNELGRSRLERKDLDGAEIAFVDAVKSFKEVSDYTNIILINCNMGHGRRASAEEMVLKIQSFKKHAILHNAYKQALETAKLEYCEALMYYGAAKLELKAIPQEADSVPCNLKDEVYTQFAHTYLRLGMLLAKEETVAEVYESGVLEDYTSPIVIRPKKEHRKHEISANDAIREALSVYESLGELRKQEAAYAYFHLACYQRDCCLKLFESDTKKNNLSRGENQRVKQYASLADRNWQKSIDFYGAETHPLMYLTILIERSALFLSLSGSLHSNMLLESALTRLLEARHLSVHESFSKENPDVCSRFWNQLRMLLKRMLSVTLPVNAQKAAVNSQQTSANKSGEIAKLRELYKMSLKSSEFSELHAIHNLWTS
ncbi:hypothetical protein ACH5RR_033705 [Cinchona calisaya]|uniref:EDRF1 N-terminal domain-containing protein n=1 Tax=Cinchona calisaya TaxID=153742 RepID=A0ABD2Y8Q9_9GENT